MMALPWSPSKNLDLLEIGALRLAPDSDTCLRSTFAGHTDTHYNLSDASLRCVKSFGRKE